MRQTLLLFLGILVLGSPVLLPSIHMATDGKFHAWMVAVLALVAMWASDSVWYALGRVLPVKRLLRFRPVARRLHQVAALRRRVPIARLLFLSRFLYGTRIAANILCGVIRTPYARVATVNFASSVLWLALLFGLALSIGSAAELFLSEGESMRWVVAVLVLTGFALQLGFARLSSVACRKARADTTTAEASDAPFPPQISVIVPAFNEERYLGRAIRSVRRQRVPAEVVVVENGSTDDTASIAAHLADRVIRSRERLGYSRARNLGALSAQGSLFVFLDADSEMAPNALEEIGRFARSPGALGTVLGRPDRPEWRYRFFFSLKNIWQRLGLYRGVLGGLLFCDGALYKQIQGFDEEMQIDELRDFIARASRSGGKYRILTGTYSTTSMRRFEAVGLLRSLWFWTRLRLGVEPGLEYWHRNYRAGTKDKSAASLRQVGAHRSSAHPRGSQDARSSILGP